MENESPDQGSKFPCGFMHRKKHMWCHGSGGAFYGLGLLGASGYYLTTATSLTGGVIGVVKAILWPAFLVYGLLKFIGA